RYGWKMGVRGLPGFNLERNIVVGDAHVGGVGLAGRGALVEGRGVGPGVATTAFAAASGFTEEGQFVHENLGLVALLAGFFVVPGAGLNFAFDIKLGAFFYVVSN